MPIERHRQRVHFPPPQYRPEVRWWLAEGLHTDHTLKSEVEAIHRLGFGGVEFLAMEVDGIDPSRYSWGSEEWIHDSHVVSEHATRHGLGVSFTSGTNWANANLNTIDADHPAASQELDVTIETVHGGMTRTGALPEAPLDGPRPGGPAPAKRVPGTRQDLVAVVAAPILASLEHGAQLSALEALDLTPHVRDGMLQWTAPDERTWQLSTYWMHGTGQIAEPSMSTNFTVNYIDPDGSAAVIDYWDRVVLTPELRRTLEANPLPQLYMDSLELFTWGQGGMFWGSTMLTEFRQRRGYDVTPWLPFLTRIVTTFSASTVYRNEPDEQNAAAVRKVRSDYVRTLTDLYVENMLRPLRAFLHRNGMTLRAEVSYGMPFELSRPGADVDGVETESLEFGAQIDGYRMLSGVSHLLGKQYSSETGATTRNHMLNHRFYDQIIATQFAAGVSRTVLHGWASMAGPEGTTSWPGHEGMYPIFSERFDLRQPASEFYPFWNNAMGRVQYLLRQGRPRIDVGILRTDHFIDNLAGMHFIDGEERIPDEEMYGNRWMRDRENHWWRDLSMQDAGWTYEFLDGSLLLRDDVECVEGQVQPAGPGYQALIVYQEELDADVAHRLVDWARDGLRVVVVDGATELALLSERRYVVHEHAASRTPGLDNRDEELTDAIAALLALPTATRVPHPSHTLSALRDLGVAGRAEFLDDNPSVLTHLREDEDLWHLFAYNFQYEKTTPTDVEIRLPDSGTLLRHDHWQGAWREHDGAWLEGDQTAFRVSLRPGEIALFTLERDARVSITPPNQKRIVASIDEWDLTVHSWEAGPTDVTVENRGLGYETREAVPRTFVRVIDAGRSSLKSWAKHPAIGEAISGVSAYTADVHVSELTHGARYLLDLGSTAGALGTVTINNDAPIGFDTSSPRIDVTNQLRRGTNHVQVKVSSSLNNRLRADGFYETVPDIIMAFRQQGVVTHDPPVRHYGLLGPVHLIEERRIANQ